MSKHCGDEGCMECENDALRAEVADLKARLQAAREGLGYTMKPSDVELVARATDLRRTNWRKP